MYIVRVIKKIAIIIKDSLSFCYGESQKAQSSLKYQKFLSGWLFNIVKDYIEVFSDKSVYITWKCANCQERNHLILLV